MSYSRFGFGRRSDGPAVPRLESFGDLLSVVAEVEDERSVLAVTGPVKSRQRLHGGEPGQRLVDVHRIKKRLIESRLVLLGNDEDLPFVVELLGRLTVGEAVHLRLGDIDTVVGDRAGERDEHRDVAVAVGGNVLVERPFVAHRMQPGGGDDHRLGLTVDFVGDMGAEVLDDDLGLLRQVVFMQPDEAGDRSSCRRRLILRVVVDGLLDPPVHVVGDVVLEHVTDESLGDRLAHRVEVEWFEPGGLDVLRAE